MKVIVLTLIFISSCKTSYRTIGIYNSTQNEIVIETKPNIKYSGGPEKYIGLEEDSTNRGLVWKFGNINSIIVYPIHYGPTWDTAGIYIMKSNSAFNLGGKLLKRKQELSYEDLEISFLKIITANDTIIADSKIRIWKLLNYDRSNKKLKWVSDDKAIIVY